MWPICGFTGQPNCIPHSMLSLCQSKPNMFYAWLVMANLSQIDMSITTQCYTLRTKHTMSSCFSLVAIYYKKFLYVNSKDCHCLTMSYVDDEKTIDDSMTPISATGSFTTQTLKKLFWHFNITILLNHSSDMNIIDSSWRNDWKIILPWILLQAKPYEDPKQTS